MGMEYNLGEISVSKMNLLAGAGWRWFFDEGVWASKVKRKMFSYEWVKNHDEDELREAIQRPVLRDRWDPYLGKVPAPGAIDNIIAKLG
jgi:hypothetical protein